MVFSVPLSVVASAPAGVEELVRGYYSGVMHGRAVAYDLQLRRLPELKPNFEIVRIHGEEINETPRGARICWLEVNEGSKLRQLPITVRIRPVERVPVAIADIESRTPLSSEMVVWQNLPTEKLGAAHISRLAELNGAWAKVRIPAGTIITSRRIERMPRVVIGQFIKLVFRVGRIEATAEGKALEDGRVGEKINVLNLVSNVRLRGRVAEDGTVTVE